jgi:hypothetical protein
MSVYEDTQWPPGSQRSLVVPMLLIAIAWAAFFGYAIYRFVFAW